MFFYIKLIIENGDPDIKKTLKSHLNQRVTKKLPDVASHIF
jgi:hypothetical protein